MTHKQHCELISKAIQKPGGVWADLGSGTGAFTLALRDLAGPQVEIFSIDVQAIDLQEQEQTFETKFPSSKIHFIEADFTKPLDIKPLDGILMANSLHYIRQQSDFLTRIKKYLKPQGKIVFVEYNSNDSVHWVPYPLSYKRLSHKLILSGFKEVELLDKISSRWLNEMYCAQALLRNIQDHEE